MNRGKDGVEDGRKERGGGGTKREDRTWGQALRGIKSLFLNFKRQKHLKKGKKNKGKKGGG